MLPSAPTPGFAHVVVGLGNPGAQYETTRHNVGFMVVDALAARLKSGVWRRAGRSLVDEALLEGRRLLLAKPQTFMNRSGKAVEELLAVEEAPCPRLLVVHDDLDLPLGRLRIRDGGGHGGHNGLRSILEILGTGAFVRLKVGIGRPAEGEGVTEHVLSPFEAGEQAVLPGVLLRATDAVESIILEGPERAMNRFNWNQEKGREAWKTSQP